MIPTQTKLRSCLAIDDFSKRRAAIRKLFTETVSDDLARRLSFAVKDAMLESLPPSVAKRPTISVIRDNLTITTMALLIESEAMAAATYTLGGFHPRLIADHTMDCITDISKCSTGRGGKHRFAEFNGAEKLLARHLVDTTHLASTTTETLPMSLTAALNAYDFARLNGHLDEINVWGQLAEATDGATSDGVKSLVGIREEKDAPKTGDDINMTAMTADEYKLFERICGALEVLDGFMEKEPVKAVVLNPPADSALIDLALSQAGLPPINDMITTINTLTEDLEKAESTPAIAITAASEETKHDGTIPSGRLSTQEAWKAFGLTRGKEQFGFKVPTWEWDGVHPHVPEVDEDYVFRPFELLRVLYAVMTNQRCYLHGHTGTGKTTLIEQVAARLNWPFMRVNFDSEITRMDLIGRDVLTNEGGVTSSKFVDGILPQMMSGPYIGCLDEIDFVRPDIAYVLQRAAEGNGLMLTEDGGRMVKPHKLFRMFATGNTVGQGDEYGMYQGARPQSMAFLDRFTVWVKVDYLKPADRKKLIKSRLPKLDDAHAEKLNNYITEHLTAFTQSKVMQPISPRGFLSLGQAMTAYMSFITDEKKAVEEAIATTILDRASVNDRAVLKAISQRVWG